MNKDEMKMIEDMARIICKETSNEGLCEKCEFKKHEQFGFTYQCRKFDDAEALYNANCRIIADDEIVIKKSEYVVIPKQDWEDRAYIHAMENHLCQKCRDMIGVKFVAKEEANYWKNRCKEIGDVASKETAKELLQELYDEAMRYTNEVIELSALQIKQLAKEKGIELEKNL